MEEIARRTFIKATAMIGFPTIIPASVLGKNSPSNRITLGCIGMGGEGSRNLRNFLGNEDAQVLAVCDVWDNRSKAQQNVVNKHYKGTGCKSTMDCREIIADKSIDAVVISTPDHWHVPLSLMALEAGKDVFSEKPTLSIAEGRTLIDEVKKHKAVFQVGLEDRSVSIYHKMIEWLRNGEIGELERVDVTMPPGITFPLQKEIPVPKGLNYELFVGPAEYIHYCKNRTGQQHWRNTHNFSNGKLLDWGTHLVDTAQLAANAPGVCPVEIEAEGEIPKNSMTTVPVTYDVKYLYSNGVKVQVRSRRKSEGNAIRLTGSTGWVGNDNWRAQLKASDPKILNTKYAAGASKHWPLPPNEQRNFLDCVKSRKQTTYTAETLHRLCTTLHAGDIAIRLGRKLKWDSKKEEFIDDDTANAMRSREARDDWKKKG